MLSTVVMKSQYCEKKQEKLHSVERYDECLITIITQMEHRTQNMTSHSIRMRCQCQASKCVNEVDWLPGKSDPCKNKYNGTAVRIKDQRILPFVISLCKYCGHMDVHVSAWYLYKGPFLCVHVQKPKVDIGMSFSISFHFIFMTLSHNQVDHSILTKLTGQQAPEFHLSRPHSVQLQICHLSQKVLIQG